MFVNKNFRKIQCFWRENMQLIELAAQYRATGNALRARAAPLRRELAAMPRAGRARRANADHGA